MLKISSLARSLAVQLSENLFPNFQQNMEILFPKEEKLTMFFVSASYQKKSKS